MHLSLARALDAPSCPAPSTPQERSPAAASASTEDALTPMKVQLATEDLAEIMLAMGTASMGHCGGQRGTHSFPCPPSAPPASPLPSALLGASPKQRLSLEAALPAAAAIPEGSSSVHSHGSFASYLPAAPASPVMRLGLVTPKRVKCAPERRQMPTATSVMLTLSTPCGAAEEAASTTCSPTTSSLSSETSDQESPARRRTPHLEESGIAIVPESRMPAVAFFPPGLELTSASHAQDLLSVGSALHSTGGCRPCAWFWKEVGCQNGASCSYCHLCSEGALKAKKKSKLTMKAKFELSLASLI